jgi:hypothetical protein
MGLRIRADCSDVKTKTIKQFIIIDFNHYTIQIYRETEDKIIEDTEFNYTSKQKNANRRLIVT